MRNLLICRIRVFSLLLLVLFAQGALAHPGKTDYQDGHKCLKNCSDWDLYYSEYHLHDKDRNAIRVEGRKKGVKAPAPAGHAPLIPALQESAAAPVEVPEPPARVPARRSPADRGYSMPVETGFALSLYDIILLGVAGLLLLAMLFLRRKRERD